MSKHKIELRIDLRDGYDLIRGASFVVDVEDLEPEVRESLRKTLLKDVEDIANTGNEFVRGVVQDKLAQQPELPLT